jgi:hypothetical protein
MELKWSAHNRHVLVPQMHENSFKNNKTVNPKTGCHTAVVNGRTFRVTASAADRRSKKQHNWCAVPLQPHGFPRPRDLLRIGQGIRTVDHCRH